MNITLQGLLQEGQSVLESAHIAEAELDARYLLLEVFQMNTALFLIERTLPAQDEKKIDEYRKLIQRRAERIPLQYLTGSREFMGFDFKVNKNVLIPRQDTETLVEEVLKDWRSPEISVLDLCTGSGCIGISLFLLGRYAEVLGTDISQDALEVAVNNAALLCISVSGNRKIHFKQSDLFEALTGAYENYFDVIVSNPPYIPTSVMKELEPEVRSYEPVSALDGKDDGLFFYRILAVECSRYLKSGGQVYFEIGYDQAEDVSALLKESGFEDVRVIQDAAGLDRVVNGRWDGQRVK